MQINQTSIGQQNYNLVEKVGKDTNIFSSLYKAIDLGLPSGALWADKNIGAATPEDVGLYFQWGDTQGYTAEQVGNEEGQKGFRWADYKWSIDGSSTNFSKYNALDSKTVLDPEDDAAHINMGGNWRMPTFDEYKELFINTDIYLVQTDDKEIHVTGSQNDEGGYAIEWTSRVEGALKGIKFYKKSDKQTYMFVPVSGEAILGSIRFVSERGYLWSSLLISSDVQNAYGFGFNGGYGFVLSNYRYNGNPVRGIMSNI